jgi:hypothetical protein
MVGSDSSPVSGHNNRHVRDDQYIKLFVGCLPFDATEQDLQPLFEKYGDVRKYFSNTILNFV